MIVGLFKGLGKLAVFAATMAFLSGVSLLLLGSFLMTWPIMRKSPRDQKIKVSMDLAVAALNVITVMGRERMAQMASTYVEIESDDI